MAYRPGGPRAPESAFGQSSDPRDPFGQSSSRGGSRSQHNYYDNESDMGEHDPRQYESSNNSHGGFDPYCM